MEGVKFENAPRKIHIYKFGLIDSDITTYDSMAKYWRYSNEEKGCGRRRRL